MSSATIKIFLVRGDPKLLRTAELSNWIGKAVAGPRSEFDSVLAREEATSSGVYLLTGHDAETGKPSVYIGEAESIKERVKSHLVKDFWNQIVYFISKDENLTKAHIRYLEGRLIELAKQADRAVLVNNQASGSKLPESDRQDMEVFLEKLLQLLPALGVEVMIPKVTPSRANKNKEMLLCAIKGLHANGYMTPNGIVVLEGSQAVLAERKSAIKSPWVVTIRNNLQNDGSIAAKDDHFVFTKDVEFLSPSAAAAVIHGGTANGLTAWKNPQGKTLKELETQ